MRTIYKYPLAVTGYQTVAMPYGASVLDIQYQPAEDAVCLWALVDPEEPAETREVWVVGTGHPFPSEANGAFYAGTFQVRGRRLVCHVFVGD